MPKFCNSNKLHVRGITAYEGDPELASLEDSCSVRCGPQISKLISLSLTHTHTQNDGDDGDDDVDDVIQFITICDNPKMVYAFESWRWLSLMQPVDAEYSIKIHRRLCGLSLTQVNQ